MCIRDSHGLPRAGRLVQRLSVYFHGGVHGGHLLLRTREARQHRGHGVQADVRWNSRLLQRFAGNVAGAVSYTHLDVYKRQGPKALSAGSLAGKRSFFDKPKGGAAKLKCPIC